MGLRTQYFRPGNLPAPLAVYSSQALHEASDHYLAALIAVMANFQRIYRPEIDLSRIGFGTLPGEVSQASLSNQEYDLPAISYDRNEREQLAEQQAQFIEETLMKPHGEVLERLLRLDP